MSGVEVPTDQVPTDQAYVIMYIGMVWRFPTDQFPTDQSYVLKYSQCTEIPNDQSYVIKYSQCGGAYGSGFNWSDICYKV